MTDMAVGSLGMLREMTGGSPWQRSRGTLTVCRAEADDLLNALAGAFASLRERAMGNEIDWMFEGAQVAGDPFDDMVL